MDESYLDNKHIPTASSRKEANLRPISIEVRADRVVISPVKRAATQKARDQKGGGQRSRVSKFTIASRRRFIEHAMQLSSLRYSYTFTYPLHCYPASNEELKRQWTRLCDWLRRQRAAGIAMKEFNTNGCIHYHVVLEAPLAIDKARRRWSEIIGCDTDWGTAFSVDGGELVSKDAVPKLIW